MEMGLINGFSWREPPPTLFLNASYWWGGGATGWGLLPLCLRLSESNWLALVVTQDGRTRSRAQQSSWELSTGLVGPLCDAGCWTRGTFLGLIQGRLSLIISFGWGKYVFGVCKHKEQAVVQS